MPFKSQAQRRKFAEMMVRGEISPETFEEWNRETGSAKLPERVGSRKKAAAKKGTTRKKRPAAKKAPRKAAAAKKTARTSVRRKAGRRR